MKANTSRENRLAFNNFPEQYIAFQRSQANGNLISDAVANRIREALGSSNNVMLDNHIAVTIARK